MCFNRERFKTGVIWRVRGRVSRRVIAAVAALGLAVGLAACSPEVETVELGIDQVDGALPDDAVAQMQGLVETAMTGAGASGGIVSVSVPWAGQWIAGLGSSTPDGGTVDPSMTFKATSITRSMTCDVLYGMAAEGTVALDDTVGEWLDTYPGESDLTLEQLCDSTSGLHPYLDEIFPRLLTTPDRVWNPRELVAYGLGQGPVFRAGSRFGDSDTGYTLLGIVLERAAQRPLAELYDRYVFEPLGMTHSSFPTGVGSMADRLAGLYSANTDGAVDCAAPRDLTDLTSSAGAAAAGAVSTVSDLATYVRALAVGARSYDSEQRFADPRPTGTSQASWFTADGGAYQAGSLVGQYGSLPGYMTAAFADRETGMSVVVVLNNSRASATVARVLAWQLAAVASKTPAAEGRETPQVGLPWTAESLAAQMADLAVCGE